MNKILFSILFVIFQSFLISAVIPTYKCRGFTTSFQTSCVIRRKIKLNETNFHFYPQSKSHDHLIKWVDFNNNFIPVLSHDICDAFPNVEMLMLAENNINVIHSNAFRNCTKLEGLFLYRNNINQIGSHLLRNSPNLHTLMLSTNNIKTLPKHVFDYQALKELRGLYLDKNHLSYLTGDEFKGLDMLEKLHIKENELSDIDEKNLIKNLPKLKEIMLTGNNFTCERIAEIKEAFEEHDIKVEIDNKSCPKSIVPEVALV